MCHDQNSRFIVPLYRALRLVLLVVLALSLACLKATAESMKPDDRWNVPIGLTVAKTTKIGKLPIKFEFGGEYSVVHEEDYGQRWQIKLDIIPVIPALIKKPLFD